MKKEIICAGFGGQGVLTAGMILAKAGMEMDKNVLFYPSYGSEMRGGTANCTVKISDGKIARPVSRRPDIVFTLNTPAVDKFEPILKENGILFINSSIVPEKRKFRDDITVVKVPVTDISGEEENPKAANLAMLGALAEMTDLFDTDYLEKEILRFFESKGKGKYNQKNVACYRRGVEAVKHDRQ